MSFQAIRGYIEFPVITAYSGVNVPVYVDNMTMANTDIVDEYIDLDINFNGITESLLQSNLNYVRGVIVLGIFAPKNKGPRRAEDLSMIGMEALQNINSCGGKPSVGTYATIRNFNGPTLTELDEVPYAVSYTHLTLPTILLV